MRTRVSKLTYGGFCDITYDPNDSSHVARVSKSYITTSGIRRISDYFDIILPIVTLSINLSWFLTDILNGARILKFLKRRNSRGRIGQRRSLETSSNRFRFPFHVIVETWLIPAGKTSIQVSFVETRLSCFFRYLTSL